MEVSAGNVGATRVLQVRGRLDHSQAHDFETALAPHLLPCTADGTPLVLDFSGVVYISSVGLRVLLLAAKQVKAQQGQIAIAALTPIVTEVFQVSHFNLVLSVYPDVDAAVAAMGA
ncbi:MAG: STAS domain-containing protein [Burkholderiaceae bacterium]